MAEAFDEVAARAWSRGRASAGQRVAMVAPLMRGEPRAVEAHAEAVLPSRVLQRPAPSAPALAGAFARARRRADGTMGVVQIEREQAGELVFHFAALPPEVLAGRLDALDGTAVTASLVEALAAQGWRQRFGAPAIGLLWTSAAVRLGASLSPDQERYSAVLAQAWAYHGNALRIANRYPEAEAALRDANRWLASSAVLDLRQKGELCRLEASLAVDVSQFDRALRLLGRAQRCCEQVGDREGLARITMARAQALACSGRAEEAVSLWAAAGDELEQLGLSRLAAVARHGRLSALLNLGRFAEALPLLDPLRQAYDPVADRQDLVRLAWLEGRALAGLGRLEAAEHKLRQVREIYIADGLHLNAAFATLDLAGVLLRQRRWAELAASATAMAGVFDRVGTHREAVAALELLGLAARRAEVDDQTLEATRKRLEALDDE